MERIIYDTCPSCNSSDIELALHTKDYSISKEDFDIWHCTNCTLRFTQNVPPQDEIAPYYKSDDYISHSDNKEGIVNNLYHRVRSIMLERKYKIVKKYSRTNRLLDYGAGTGYFPAHVKSKGHEVIAMEIDEHARTFSKEKFGLDVLDPDVLKDQSWQQESFDVITLWHVMEHLYDPASYIKRFHKLLAENGHLIIAVPNYESSDAEYYNEKWAAYDVPRHLWHFSPKSMERLVSNHGFTMVDKETMPFDSFYVSLLSEKYKHGTSSLLGGFLRGFKSYSKSSRDVNKCSSVIYIFRKKQ